MKRVVTQLIFCFLIIVTSSFAVTAVQAQSQFRRGTSANNSFSRYEFYVVDSDDNAPNAPASTFIDTTFGVWQSLLTASYADDTTVAPHTVVRNIMPYYIVNLSLDTTSTGNVVGIVASTNGVIGVKDAFNDPKNTALPNSAFTGAFIAPLWGDWEFRGSDSSKLMYRAVHDTVVLSYYNLALKGTNGAVRATFQVVFRPVDSTITFNYRSFTGSYNGVAAAELIQRVATIGMQYFSGEMGITYLHKGTYYATNPSSIYNQPLHNGLSVKFYMVRADAFAITNITSPPYDRYELPTNVLTPSFNVFNSTDTTIKIFFHTTVTNTVTNSTIYNRSDSLIVSNQSTGSFTGPSYNGIGCGLYRETVTASFRDGVSDAYAGNNTSTRFFSVLSTQSLPFREEFNPSYSTCAWTNAGAEVVDGANLFYTVPGPMTGGQKALLMNRLNSTGASFAGNSGGDTLTSAPMDLSGKTNVNVMFHYQRGLRSDSSQAGIVLRMLSGPETQIANHAGGYIQTGDSLIVEGLLSTGATWNPSAASWSRLGAIPGGFDVTMQTFRVGLTSSFLHNHFRFRLRVKASDNESYHNLFEDADNFLVDEVHVEQLQANKTELEPVDIDLGNGDFTHVPRDISFGLTPKVRVRNNGDGVTLGLSLLHVVIHDALNRAVYDKLKAFSFPQPLADSLFPMPAWDIRGSQGGAFTIKVSIEQPFYDTYYANDTNVFYKTMYIDDRYALDDETADTVGTRVNPSTNFTYEFTPLGNDTLRGAEFYYTAASSSSSWSLVVTWGNNTATRTFLLNPTGPGFFRSTFPAVAMSAGTTYHMHFTMNSGSNLGGDASNGLVYFKTIDTANAANNVYGELHQNILDQFNYVANATDATQGGTLLPMMRLVFSGSATFLPVKLVSLSATRTSDGAVVLNWKTAAEENAYNFEVQRVNDDFLAGSLMAKNQSQGASYALRDGNAPAAATTYELIERDLDGSRQALGRVTAEAFDSQAALALVAYPNPSTGFITVVPNKHMGSLRLVDPLGRTLKALAPTDAIIRIDVSDLSAGSYFLEAMSTSGETRRLKISVMH